LITVGATGVLALGLAHLGYASANGTTLSPSAETTHI